MISKLFYVFVFCQIKTQWKNEKNTKELKYSSTKNARQTNLQISKKWKINFKKNDNERKGKTRRNLSSISSNQQKNKYTRIYALGPTKTNTHTIINS